MKVTKYQKNNIWFAKEVKQVATVTSINSTLPLGPNTTAAVALQNLTDTLSFAPLTWLNTNPSCLTGTPHLNPPSSLNCTRVGWDSLEDAAMLEAPLDAADWSSFNLSKNILP
jgi:hypothetical protein